MIVSLIVFLRDLSSRALAKDLIQRIFQTILCTFFCICLSFTLKAQQNNLFFDKINAYNKSLPIEKIYLSFDKPYYSIGDTLWFKSYLLNGDFTSSQRTDKIYVELFNDSLIKVDNRVIALNNGLGYGDFALTDKLAEGTYTMRAYSNWQQNFGSDYFFQKTFYIGNAGEKTWLVDSYQKLNTTATNTTLELKIRLSNLKNQPSGLRDVEVYLMNDQKKVMKANLQTNVEGKIETTIPLTNRITGNYSFHVVDRKDRTKKVMFPILLQVVDDLDLQFMPEGGYIVNDIYGKVAFKAIGADGLGRTINGKIVNNKNENVGDFKSQHNGMGSFFLLSQKGENYTAIYNLNGNEKRQKLPLAKEEGTTLRIDHLTKADSISIYIKASESKRVDGYQLLGQSAGNNVLSAQLSLKNGFINLKLPKNDFPDGIVHFTLFSPENQPLNERNVFINQRKKINLKVNATKNSYQIRDSVALDIIATNENGIPLSGSFSISVTDDNQVKQKQDEENIISHFLLQSEVKGNIENAGWYFANQEPPTLLALDHLLLTQAWIGYKWNEILTQKTAPNYKAEKDNIIEGRLNGLLNKPAANIKLNLLSLGKNVFFTDTVSNVEGKFLFKGLPIVDSAAYIIKIKNLRGKTANATIKVNEFTPSKEILLFKPLKPWYVNTDDVLLNYFKNAEKQNIEKEQQLMKLSGNMLKAVEIKGKNKLALDSATWDAKFLKQITEEELKKTPRKTLFELIKEQLPGLTISDFWQLDCSGRPKKNFNDYVVGVTRVNAVMIDNISTSAYAAGGGTAQFEANKFLFQYFNAEDVKDIKIYKGCFSYIIDIKSRSGNGPWMGTATGVYVYRPLPFYISREFYSPKYTTINNNLPDYRSTIFWDANIVTDENGKAKLSFYAADKPSNYTIKLEGTDLYGRFGYQKSTITIKNKTESK